MIIRFKKKFLIPSTVTLIIVMFIRLTSGEPTRVQVKVDGLSCPFCAYNLEKKLKRVEGVEDLKLRIDTGLAEIKIEEGKSIDIDGIEKAVKDGGFTPREILVTLKGRIEKVGGKMALKVDNVSDVFTLKYNEILNEITADEQAQDKFITITGLVQEEKIEGHGVHAFALEIRDFKFE